ncbi:hypothetical protein EAI_15724 [Harpegnathos saltator]|uniref:Uncharacterized protein n=1 Tax=Harpegnathos saltator TaxID=610380 RepID=E2BKB8_HARSA|nr:hypothetical protein EAI_15724 [Harpegnathos saltator]
MYEHPRHPLSETMKWWKLIEDEEFVENILRKYTSNIKYPHSDEKQKEDNGIRANLDQKSAPSSVASETERQDKYSCKKNRRAIAGIKVKCEYTYPEYKYTCSHPSLRMPLIEPKPIVFPDLNVPELRRSKTASQASTSVCEKVAPLKPSDNTLENSKDETPTHKFLNLENKKSVPNILASFYESPNRYLIVEDMRKVSGLRNMSLEEEINSCDQFMEFNTFAIYQEMPIEQKQNGKEQEESKIKPLCKLELGQPTATNYRTIFYLKGTIKCLFCKERMKAGFNIRGDSRTVMYGE